MNIEEYERRASDFLDLMPDHENDAIPEDKSEENRIYYTYSPLVSVCSDDYSGYTINSPHIPVWGTTTSTTTAWTTGWNTINTSETLPF